MEDLREREKQSEERDVCVCLHVFEFVQGERKGVGGGDGRLIEGDKQIRWS